MHDDWALPPFQERDEDIEIKKRRADDVNLV